jgi:serpin B
VAGLVAGCGSIEEVAGAHEVRSSVDREQLPGDLSDAAVDRTTALAAALYRQAIGTEHGNLVFSPYSIEIALAMTRAGAKGITRSEMDAVIGAGPGVDIDRSLNALDSALTTRNGERGRGERTGEVNLRTANALWAQKGVRWDGSFLDLLARHYGAGVSPVDYVGDGEGARSDINSWTSERTNQKIPELIPKGVLTVDTRLVLTNAVWFKAPWANAFSYVSDAPFHRQDGTAPTVKTMIGGGSRYGRGTGWQAAAIPYLGDELEMVVIVPDDLAAFELTLDGPTLARITGGLDQPVDSVTMPSFRYRTALSLKDQLKAMGMPTAFTDGADFSGMTTDEKLRIADVLHEGFIAVDDQGTEAAAATAVIAEQVSAEPETNRLVADKPFVYVIRDKATGAPVFVGRVVDPAATSD